MFGSKQRIRELEEQNRKLTLMLDRTMRDKDTAVKDKEMYLSEAKSYKKKTEEQLKELENINSQRIEVTEDYNNARLKLDIVMPRYLNDLNNIVTVLEEKGIVKEKNKKIIDFAKERITEIQDMMEELKEKED